MKIPSILHGLLAALTFLLSTIAASDTAQAQRAEQIRLNPNTTITITPRGMSPEESAAIGGPYNIGADGNITGLHLLPNNGTMRAAGKTPEQLAREIEQAYIRNGFYTRIRLTIQTPEIGDPNREQTVTFGGEVNRAGVVVWRPGLNLVQAIAQAGGRSQFASDKVVVQRGEQLFELNLKNAQDRTFALNPNDYIEVWEAGMFRPIPPSR